jgi:hypothetical protein
VLTFLQLDDWVLCKIFCNNGHHDAEADEDVDGTVGDQDLQVVTFEQGGPQQGDLDEAARGTEEHTDSMRIVSDQQTLVSYPGVEDLCLEDYLGCDDPTFIDQDHAAK